jgi:oligosaccharide repeat unit polymerase
MFVDILFLTFWLILPFFWHYLFKAAGLSLLRVTIPSIVIISMYAYQYIGLPILYFKLNSYRADSVVDKYLMFEVFMYTSLTITMMGIGFILARQGFGRLKNKFDTSVLEKNYSSAHFFRTNMGVFVLATISTLVLIKYISQVEVGNTALFITLGVFESDLSPSELRSSMGNAFDGNYHWYKVFMNDLMTLSLFVIFSRYLLRNSTTTKVMLVGISLITCFVMVMAIEKGPMANLVVGLFLVYVVTRLSGRVPLKKTIYMFIVLLVMLTTFFIYFMNSESVSSSLSSIFSRIFTGQIQPAYHYLDYFQNYHDKLLGRSLPNPKGIFSFEHFHLTKEIAAWHNPLLEAKGIVGSMPTVFWGEMYANFGFFGVPISSLLVGFSLYWLNAILLKFEQTPILVGLYVWMMMHFSTLSATGLSTFMLDTYMFFIVLAFLLLSFYVGQGTIRYYKKPVHLTAKNKIY